MVWLPRTLIVFISLSISMVCKADELPLHLFPLQNYDQTISTWLDPAGDAYDQRLMSQKAQITRLHQFYDHYVGRLSPWDAQFVNRLINQAAPDDIATQEKAIIQQFANHNDEWQGYGENFRVHSDQWIEAIAEKIPYTKLQTQSYHANARAITVFNTHVRVLPTNDVHFYHYTYVGQGYPFDNLQMSAIWVGTPLYVVGETNDHAWKLVLTPSVMGWVPANHIASVNAAFVKAWRKAAHAKLIAITKTETSVLDEQHRFLFTTYVGAVFPASQSKANALLVPMVNANQQAVIRIAKVYKDHSTVMPLKATPHHFADIMTTLIGRPYGWGGMYFYNDCSQELKSLFTPFGIWLPRHSSQQVKQGKLVDMTAASYQQRIDYLRQHGKPLLTLVYVGGHIFLYVGNYPNPYDASAKMIMTYQSVWGLGMRPPKQRVVIGQSVLLPLLPHYPDDNRYLSQANEAKFQVAFLHNE